MPHKTSRKYALLLGKDPSLVMKIGSLEEANWQFLHYHEKLALRFAATAKFQIMENREREWPALHFSVYDFATVNRFMGGVTKMACDNTKKKYMVKEDDTLHN